MRYPITGFIAFVAQATLSGATASSLLLPGFVSPPSAYRPKFRYWLPDASVPSSSIVGDVQSIADVGGGGIELLAFYNYGLGPAFTDWSAYGFGTEAFKDIFTAALNASASNGLEFDFSFGANQGQGVPSETETPGLAMELVYANVTLAGAETFTGALPEPNIAFNALTGFMSSNELWGSNKLVAVVAARVEYETPLEAYFWAASLSEESLVDLTNLTTDGMLTWRAPEGNGTWVLFAFYERYSMQRSCVSIPDAPTALGNGSWVVDHFSTSGAKKMTDFWDEHILSDNVVRGLLQKAGGYAWEDSLEMQSALWWTPGFLERFEEARGYSLVQYLPLIFHASNQWAGYLPPYNTTYNVGPYSTTANRWTQDYRLTLEKGYADYLTHYENWAAGIGLGLRTQPAYNLPMEMAKAVPLVTVPELESLGFSDDIDQYRQFVGAAHLADIDVISTEVGAVNTGPYKLTVPELASLFDGSFATGVNNMVIHGFAYEGEYVGTNWPGYTPFQFEYTEMWGPRLPAWDHLNDTLLYAARNSMVLRKGVPRIDVAFYYYQNPWLHGQDIYTGEDFNAAGYTHEYLGPSNLVSEQTVIEDGVMAPAGPAFKALVIFNQTQIDPVASAALVSFSYAGLPIFIVGPVPNTTIGTTGQVEVSKNMESLMKAPNVQVLSLDQFSASTLQNAGITPRARVQGEDDASKLVTFWRSDTDSDTEMVYLLNRGPGGSFNVTCNVPKASTATPYVLDAWTGTQEPLLAFHESSSGISVNISLQQNQSTIVLFSRQGSAQDRPHVLKHSNNVSGFQVNDDGQIEALVDAAGFSVSLSNGPELDFPAGEALQNVTIGPWSLAVEAYGPSGSNDTVAGDITTIDVGTLDTLVPWTKIARLEQVSGVGTYTATFDFPYACDTVAAILSFGLVLNTLRAWINGQLVPAVNLFDPVIDVSEFLVKGSNNIKVQVSSTLFNAVKANLDGIQSIGYGPHTPTRYTDEAWAEFGLLGPVGLKVLRKVVVA